MMWRSLAVMGVVMPLALVGTGAEEPASSSPPPTGECVALQSMAPRASAEAGRAGSAFFVKTSAGKAVAITSLHVVEITDGVSEVRWTLPSGAAVATSRRALTTPGRQPNFDAKVTDFRKDYLLLVPERDPVGITTLELDERPLPRARPKADPAKSDPAKPDAPAPSGERFWFPVVKDRKTVWIGGEVTVARRGHITGFLDSPATLTASSGSPVVSQETGKVIGVMTAGGDWLGKTLVKLAPIAGFRAAIEKAAPDKSVALADIDWSKHAAPPDADAKVDAPAAEPKRESDTP